MPVDHTDAVDDVEKAPESASERQRPADRPGLEPRGLSRADSRVGAAAANEAEAPATRDPQRASGGPGESFGDAGHDRDADGESGGSADTSSIAGDDGEDRDAYGAGSEVDDATGGAEPVDALAESPETARRWRTVADEQGDVHSYASFDAARKDLGVRPGKELHHIVEQGQAAPERSGFSVIRINSTDNLVHLPADVHTEVSRHYSTRLPGTDGTVRDTLTAATWDDQYQYGCEAIDNAWERIEQHRDPGEASAEPSWRTVSDELGEVRSYASFDAARNDLGVRPGKELHHIVEQGQAAPERSGFSAVRINSTDNLVHLPADVHTEVSRHYSTRLPGTDGTVRDTLTGTSWDDQHQYGCEAINDAWRRVRGDGEQ